MVKRFFEFFLPRLSKYQVPGVQERVQARFILKTRGNCFDCLSIITSIGKKDIEGLFASEIDVFVTD